MDRTRWSVLEGPAHALAARLRVEGWPEHASRLVEQLPAEPPLGNLEHHDGLIQNLDRLSFDAEISDESARVAGELARGGRDLPLLLGRTGTVYIAWTEPTDMGRRHGVDFPGHYFMHWEDAETVAEDGPDTATLEEALDWAKRRSDDILVRPAWAPADYHWAGTGPVLGNEPALDPTHQAPQ